MHFGVVLPGHAQHRDYLAFETAFCPAIGVFGQFHDDFIPVFGPAEFVANDVNIFVKLAAVRHHKPVSRPDFDAANHLRATPTYDFGYFALVFASSIARIAVPHGPNAVSVNGSGEVFGSNPNIVFAVSANAVGRGRNHKREFLIYMIHHALNRVDGFVCVVSPVGLTCQYGFFGQFGKQAAHNQAHAPVRHIEMGKNLVLRE